VRRRKWETEEYDGDDGGWSSRMGTGLKGGRKRKGSRRTKNCALQGLFPPSFLLNSPLVPAPVECVHRPTIFGVGKEQKAF
jgi:hypothetical protein